jgi:hypothetical protein
MPIAADDTCLVLFNDRNMDDWYLTGKISAPADNRIHSIADGIVLVGIRSLADLKVYPEMTTLDGGSKKIAIKNDDKDLKTLLASLNTTIKSTIDTIKDVNLKIKDLVTATAGITTVGSATAQAVTPAYKTGVIEPIGNFFDTYNTTLDTRKSDLTNLSADMALLLDEGSLI